MNSATFEATGGKAQLLLQAIASRQTDGTKTNTSTVAGNTVAGGGTNLTATTADGTTVTMIADTTTQQLQQLQTVTNANGNTKLRS